jgi:hypothetical protein
MRLETRILFFGSAPAYAKAANVSEWANHVPARRNSAKKSKNVVVLNFSKHKTINELKQPTRKTLQTKVPFPAAQFLDKLAPFGQRPASNDDAAG